MRLLGAAFLASFSTSTSVRAAGTATLLGPPPAPFFLPMETDAVEERGEEADWNAEAQGAERRKVLDCEW